MNLTNGAYTGNVYNGTGYYGQSGDTLNVNLGEDANLQGVISLTETRHIDENGEQNTGFTIEQYYYLGHVENRVYNNQSSKLAVTLSDGATWTVTDTSYLTSLTINDGTIQTADGKPVVVTVDGVETAIESGQTYTGNIIISTEAPVTPNAQNTATASTMQDSQPSTDMQPGGAPPDGGQPGGAPPDGGQPGGAPPDGGQPGGASGSPDNGSVHSTAAIYIDSGARDSSNEYTDGSVTVADAGTIGDTSASGILLTSDSYDATGLVVTNGVVVTF